MATDFILAAQKAMLEALNAALSVSVYDGPVPKSATMPYVTFADFSARTDDPLASRRDEVFATLTIWSKYRGRKEVSNIAADIYAALHQAKLTTEAGTWVRSYVTRTRTLPDIDAQTFQGSVTIRILIEH